MEICRSDCEIVVVEWKCVLVQWDFVVDDCDFVVDDWDYVAVKSIKSNKNNEIEGAKTTKTSKQKENNSKSLLFLPTFNAAFAAKKTTPNPSLANSLRHAYGILFSNVSRIRDLNGASLPRANGPTPQKSLRSG